MRGGHATNMPRKLKKSLRKHQMASRMHTCAGLAGLESENADFSLVVVGLGGGAALVGAVRVRTNDSEGGGGASPGRYLERGKPNTLAAMPSTAVPRRPRLGWSFIVV